MKPIYTFQGALADYFRREGNDWRTVKQIAAATGLRSSAVHNQLRHARKHGALLTEASNAEGSTKLYRLNPAYLTRVVTKERSAQMLRVLAPLIEALYLAGIDSKRISEELNLPYNSLRDHIYRMGLSEVRAEMQDDVIADLKAQYLKQAA